MKLNMFRITRGLTIGAGALGASFLFLGGSLLFASFMSQQPYIHPVVAVPFIIMGLTFMLLQKISDHQDGLKWGSDQDIVYRLRKRSEIRRQIPNRRSVQNNEPDRIADLLDEAADEIEKWRGTK